MKIERLLGEGDYKKIQGYLNEILWFYEYKEFIHFDEKRIKENIEMILEIIDELDTTDMY
ncbi:MAG: hypothetical protein IKT40_06300 [Bacilli bacterium]|nr:hypothetical protein [Bacilli bacterium]